MTVACPPAPDRARPAPARGDHVERFEALGTVNEVQYDARSPAAAREFASAIRGWLSSFEQRYSRFRPDSLVSRMNAGEWIDVDPETGELFALCDHFHWRTGGLFDPTAGCLVEFWEGRRALKTLPDEEEVRGVRRLVGWTRVERRSGRARLPEPGMRIDLGGIGKEYAVDRLIEHARAAGISNILVSLGRDIRAAGSPPEGGAWRIGMERPDRVDRCWQGLALRDGAVAASGHYRRYVELGGRRCSHILDPRTGWPVANGCEAAWVTAPTCTEAGILAKCALVLGEEAGLRCIEQNPLAAGCVWSPRGPAATRRFHELLLPTHRPVG